jgi:hypothetical protein
MKDCTVSIIGQDGQTYSLEVEASSAFDAVDQALQSWAKLWWYEPNAVIEVRAGRSTLEDPGRPGAGVEGTTIRLITDRAPAASTSTTTPSGFCCSGCAR